MHPRLVTVPCSIAAGGGQYLRPWRSPAGHCWKPRQFWLFGCFFLRCADSALIVLAVRGSYSLRLADAPAVSILRRRTKLDGKTNEQVKDRRAHGRQGRDAKESRSAVLRRTVQAGGQGGQGRRGQIRHSEHRTRGEGAPQGAHGPQSADGRGNQDQGEDSRASPRGKSV